MTNRHKLEKPICRREIPTKINEEQFPELFRDFYKEHRDDMDKIRENMEALQADLKEIHEWQSKHDRCSQWLRKGVRSILAESWQKIVTAIVAAVFTYGAVHLLGL